MKDIIEKFKNNSDGIRVVLLIHRSKEGGANNKFKGHLKKIITTNSDEFFEAVKKLKEIKDNSKDELRIYASCNNRDLNKAVRLFKEQQLATDYDPEDKTKSFYLDIKNRFISCLMNKSCRNEKNFLFDLDEIDEHSFITVKNRIEKQTEIILWYKTKNGYHIITKPFNYYKTLDENIIKAIQTDSLMLIDF
jgi:hypothetical protein